MEVSITADRMAAKGSNWTRNGNLPTEVGWSLHSRPSHFRSFSRKNSRLVKLRGVWGPPRSTAYRLTPSRLSSEVSYRENSTQNSDGRCGCGARGQFFRQRVINSRASHFAKPTSSSLNCNNVSSQMDRRKRRSLPSDHGVQAEETLPHQLSRRMRRRSARRYFGPPFWDGIVAGERDERRDFARLQSTLGFKESNVETSRSRKCSRFMSGLAALGLSWTLWSSAALANPITAVDWPGQTTQVSENLRTHIETQLRRDLQAQIKVQKEWLDEIGQPLSEWTIDDGVRKNLEEISRNRLDESGKPVSKLEMLESEVVPIFKPPVVTKKIEKLANAGTSSTQEKDAPSAGTDEASQETSSSRGPPSGAVQLRESAPTTPPLPAKPPPVGAPDFVTVAAVPLGAVVSAASRTVGSAASMVAMQGSAAAPPGVGLLRRIMMHFGGGGVAGAMGATLVYPLDTIKTRMQAQSNDDGEEGQYKGEWDCLQKLVAKEGPGSLYSGLLPQLLGIAPEKAMKLTVNDILMDVLVSEMPGVGPWALELIAGGGGGFSQVVFTNPMEIVKVRLQTQSKHGKQKNTWDVIKELGVQGLYNGSAITMARDIPSSAIFFAIYTLIRQVYPDQSFMAGFVAAIPATVLVTPFDVVKTRIQMEMAAGQEPYENGYVCFREILQKEGIEALFKGSLARVLKTSPQFGITLMLYNILGGGS